MRIACIQMNMSPGNCRENHSRAGELIRRAATLGGEIILLPEMWNTGFFPENVLEIVSEEGSLIKNGFSRLARELNVGIVAGSIANLREDKLYNTAYVFDREGNIAASYDKTHLFSPMGENKRFVSGNCLCSFELMGLRCGMIICYDIRFPELARTLALKGLDILFVVSQWPMKRTAQLEILSAARAIENQVFLALCNSCGTLGNTRFAGHSRIIDPMGTVLAQAGDGEEIIIAEIHPDIVSQARAQIPVFSERRPELYDCCGEAVKKHGKDNMNSN